MLLQKLEELLSMIVEMEKVNNFFKKHNNQNTYLLLFLFLFVIFSVLQGVTLSFTTSFYLDKLAYDISNYNVEFQSAINGKYPYLRIEKKVNDEKLFDDLYNEYYYDIDAKSIRQIVDNDVSLLNDETTNLTLHTQKSFSVSDTPNNYGGYRMDYGMFDAYFSSKELGGSKAYLGKHFNCDSYIFITDKFANFLCEKYKLPANKDGYLKLIKNEEYAVLKTLDRNNNEVSFSINNIVYSNTRSAERCSQFNELFGIINYSYVSDVFSLAFEIDLSNYAHRLTTVLKKNYKMGYTIRDYDFCFYRYNSKEKSYMFDKENSDQYLEIYQKKNSILPTIISAISFIAYLIIFVLFTFKLKLRPIKNLLIMVFYLILLSIYSILAAYFYTYYAFSILPIVLLITFILMKGGKTFKYVKESNILKINGFRYAFWDIEI